MAHALIIDDNMVVSRAIENRLRPHGFDTFDRAWAGRQASELAAHHHPDLIVVGDAIADGSPMDVAREIAGACDAPVLTVADGRVRLERDWPRRNHPDAPLPLVQFDTALAALTTGAEELRLCA